MAEDQLVQLLVTCPEGDLYARAFDSRTNLVDTHFSPVNALLEDCEDGHLRWLDLVSSLRIEHNFDADIWIVDTRKSIAAGNEGNATNVASPIITPALPGGSISNLAFECLSAWSGAVKADSFFRACQILPISIPLDPSNQ